MHRVKLNEILPGELFYREPVSPGQVCGSVPRLRLMLMQGTIDCSFLNDKDMIETVRETADVPGFYVVVSRGEWKENMSSYSHEYTIDIYDIQPGQLFTDVEANQSASIRLMICNNEEHVIFLGQWGLVTIRKKFRRHDHQFKILG